ncbi:cation diffusion facilitator family transporter [Nostocoides vanveenii]|uniref:Cation diffusion facilitator family transporter n=1 Tax=Nostocoides vanveenii TaxID=330835 RepID=A0ABN2KQE4_9MICO
MSAARANLTKFAWLSIAAAVVTIALKFGAYLLTGSVGLLSDAAESIVNLVAAFVALLALHVAAQPADDDHHFGHSKAEYFSAVVEGLMIFVAATFILYTSVQRFLDPQPLENVGIGLAISVGASVVNGLVALVLLRNGRRHNSITLVADGKHLMTDVWTSVGVVLGVLLVALTNWERLDPIIAFAVGCNIIWTGWHLIRESVDGLMDKAIDSERAAAITEVLARHTGPEIAYHGLRTREAGHKVFGSLHVTVPGDWTVQAGHDLTEEIETDLRATIPDLDMSVHLEPREDPRSYEAGVERPAGLFPQE